MLNKNKYILKMVDNTQEIDFRQQQALDILKSQYEMTERTLFETERRMQDEARKEVC